MSQRYIGGLIYNPPGGFSGYFDGSGDYLDAGTNAAFAVGTGNFTIELWVFPTAFSGAYTGYFTTRTGGQGFDIQILNSSATLMLGNNSGAVISANNVVVLNTWQHICAVRSGTTNSLYVNGFRVATGTDSTNFTDNGAKVGSSGPSGGNNGTGYISNVRLVKGTAVYDPTQTTITVPSGPLQAITNTSLLTCAYPTFRDGSSNNFTITVNGNTAVSVQNPFPLTQLPNPALGNQGNGVYTMSQYQALRSQNLWPAIDPYWRNVTLMLHGNGTNGAQNNTFLDSSTNAFTITRNGNTTQGTFTPYGSNWSNYFDGTGDYLSGIGTTSSFNFMHNSTALFTFECWLYWQGTTPQIIFATNNASSVNIGASITLDSGDIINVYITRGVSGAANTVCNANSVATVPKNTWTHIAVTYDQSLGSNNAKIYFNGVLDSQTTKLANAPSSSNATYSAAVGGGNTGIYTLTGYLSNLRVSNSIVYSSAFTPPANPLTAITNTSLLTCQSNRFIDNSSNAFAITVNGNPSVQRFSPFAPTTPYAAGTIGGSGYFDGSGDYLSAPNNTAFDLSTSDFTISYWIYPTSTSAFTMIATYANGVAQNSNYCFSTSMNAGGAIRFDNFSGNTQFTVTGGTVALNTWNFVTITRSGASATVYVNNSGTTGTVSSSSNVPSSSVLYIGAQPDASNPFSGYLSNFRIVKGSATAPGANPTSPLTAVSGTSILLSYTNGGIIDNAMMNDLETVGNAQISTSVSKFGGGSMSFNGSTDKLVGRTSPNLNMGSGDFTVECWVYWGGTSTLYQNFVGSNSASFTGNATFFRVWGTSAGFGLANKVGIGNPTHDSTSSVYSVSSLSTNTWTHVAATRSNGIIRLFINGNLERTGSSDTSTYDFGDNGICVGQSPWDGANGWYSGYIDDLRITKGYARYTANFTPQRSQWQDQ